MRKYWINNKPEELANLRKAVKGKRVLDLGSGDGSLGHHLLSNGAKSVIAVDGQEGKRVSHPRLKHVQMYFYDFFAKSHLYEWDIIVLSWPINQYQAMHDLLPFIEKSQEVCVLGWFDESTVVGDTPLWEFLFKWDCDQPQSHRGSFFHHYFNRPRTKPFTPLEVYIAETYVFETGSSLNCLALDNHDSRAAQVMLKNEKTTLQS